MLSGWEVEGGDTKGLEREVVDCVAWSTVCPRWEEELVGGAIVGERGGDVKFVYDSDWKAGV